MVVYLILPQFLSSPREVRRRGGVGGSREMCRCSSLSAGPGNTPDKNLIRLLTRWLQLASPLSSKLSWWTRWRAAQVHPFTRPVSAPASGWRFIPGDRLMFSFDDVNVERLQMDDKMDFNSVHVHFCWRSKRMWWDPHRDALIRNQHDQVHHTLRGRRAVRGFGPRF